MLLRRPLSLAQWPLGTGPLERYNLNLPSADSLYSGFSVGESLCLMAASPDFSHKNRTECPYNRDMPRALCAVSYQSLVPSFFASNIPPAVCSQWTQNQEVEKDVPCFINALSDIYIGCNPVLPSAGVC